jgi:hypothetical protein
VPRCDRNTGLRLSGAAQRRIARELAPSIVPQDIAPKLAPPAATAGLSLAAVGQPPLHSGINACEAWAMAVNLRAVELAAAGVDSDRVRLVRSCVRKIGQLRDKARRSEKATELRHLRQHVTADPLSAAAPIGDPIVACSWAFLRLCQVLHQICTEPDPPIKRFRDLVETLATAGFVPCKGSIDTLTRGLRQPA